MKSLNPSVHQPPKNIIEQVDEFLIHPDNNPNLNSLLANNSANFVDDISTTQQLRRDLEPHSIPSAQAINQTTTNQKAFDTLSKDKDTLSKQDNPILKDNKSVQVTLLENKGEETIEVKKEETIQQENVNNIVEQKIIEENNDKNSVDKNKSINNNSVRSSQRKVSKKIILDTSSMHIKNNNNKEHSPDLRLSESMHLNSQSHHSKEIQIQQQQLSSRNNNNNNNNNNIINNDSQNNSINNSISINNNNNNINNIINSSINSSQSKNQILIHNKSQNQFNTSSQKQLFQLQSHTATVSSNKSKPIDKVKYQPSSKNKYVFNIEYNTHNNHININGNNNTRSRVKPKSGLVPSTQSLRFNNNKSNAGNKVLMSGITEKHFQRKMDYYRTIMNDRSNPYSSYWVDKFYNKRRNNSGGGYNSNYLRGNNIKNNQYHNIYRNRSNIKGRPTSTQMIHRDWLNVRNEYKYKGGVNMFQLKQNGYNNGNSNNINNNTRGTNNHLDSVKYPLIYGYFH